MLNGITGSVGLAATLAVLETEALLALANKESPHRRRRPGARCCPTRAARPGGLRALRHRAGPAVRRGSRGPQDRAHGIRGTVPRAHPRRTGRGDARARRSRIRPGTWALVDNHQLRDSRQQGARGHRGAPALRRAVRRDRRGRASAVDRALGRRVRRRIAHRAGVAPGHAAADLARPRLAGPGAGCRGPDRLHAAHRVDLRAARRRHLPGRRAGQARRRGRRDLSRGVQRRERAGGRGLPRPPGSVPRNRRDHPRESSTPTTPPVSTPPPSPACSPPNPGPGTRPTACSPEPPTASREPPAIALLGPDFCSKCASRD